MAGLTVWPQSFSFRDDKGLTSWVRMYLAGGSLAGSAAQALTILGLITPATNAAFQYAKGPYTTPPVPASYGGTGEYSSCQDRVRLHYTTGNGAPFVVDFPAPKSVMFLADQETVNPSNSVANNLIQAFRAHAGASRDGEFITNFIAGQRIRIPLRRRSGLYVLNPQLTTPAG